MSEENHKIKVVVAFLCYRDDSDLVLESQRAAIRAFSKSEILEPTFVLVDDAWCRTRKDAREKFLTAHPKTLCFQTGYRRGNMILGGDCILGQNAAFLEIANRTEADILIKMDADTCMFKVDWIEEFAQDEKALCAGAFDFGNRNHTSVFGLCYALKVGILPDLVKDLRKYPAHHHAWEDHEVSSRIFRLANGDMDSLMRWRSNTNEDDFWVVALKQANDTCIYARAANCAWDYNSILADEKPRFRAKVCAMMKRWNDLLEEQDRREGCLAIKEKESGDESGEQKFDDNGDEAVLEA